MVVRRIVLPATLLMLACSTPPHVEERGARRIAGTEGVGGILVDVYSVSPSGSLILYSRESATGAARDPSDVLSPLHGFGLLDRATGEVRDVGVNASSLQETADRRSDLLLGSLCWSETEDAVRLGLSAGPNAVLDLNASTLEWRLGIRPSPPDPVTCPPWRVTGAQLLENTGRFLIETRDRAIRVIDRDDRDHMLLDYRGSFFARDTYVSDVRLAPDGQRIAVVVSRGTGSFTGASELYVLSLVDGEPESRSLGGPVFHVRWSRRGDELFAVSATSESGGQRAIYRWSFRPAQGNAAGLADSGRR